MMCSTRGLLLASLLLAACTAAPSRDDRLTRDLRGDSATVDSVARARQDSINRASPTYIVDSILPVEEETRRFRAAIGGAPMRALHDGAPSASTLVESFADAVAQRDTATLRRLAVTPREFIDLIYPESPYVRPPYRQAPGLLWRQIQLPSGAGHRRLLERLGGRPLLVRALRCPTVERQGRNRLHRGCVVRFSADHAPERDGRLFGTIIERDGQFKFVSYANMY